MSLSAKLTIALEALYTNANDLAAAEQDVDFSKRVTLDDGTGVGKANVLWMDERSLAAPTGEDLDLAGVLADVFGTPVAAAKIKGIVVVAADANAGNIEVGGASSNAVVLFKDATDIAVVEPGCFIAQAFRTGRTVTASTGDKLKIYNAGGSTASYKIALVLATA